MIFHAFQREDDDAVFTVVRNYSGAALEQGDAVSWYLTGVDGVKVSKPAANELGLFRGIVAESIDSSAYGKVQVHGYCSYAKVLADTTVAITQGFLLVPTTAGVLATATANSIGATGFVYAAETCATAAAAAAKKVLIRAL